MKLPLAFFLFGRRHNVTLAFLCCYRCTLFVELIKGSEHQWFRLHAANVGSYIIRLRSLPIARGRSRGNIPREAWFGVTADTVSIKHRQAIQEILRIEDQSLPDTIHAGWQDVPK